MGTSARVRQEIAQERALKGYTQSGHKRAHILTLADKVIRRQIQNLEDPYVQLWAAVTAQAMRDYALAIGWHLSWEEKATAARFLFETGKDIFSMMGLEHELVMEVARAARSACDERL